MNTIQCCTFSKVLCSPSVVRFSFFSTMMALTLLIVYPLDTAAKQEAKPSARHFQLHAITENTAIPDFTLPDLHGNSHRISDYAGHAVVINFWSTWCIPCRKEMPALERAWQRIKHEGAILLSVAMGDDLESIERFLKRSPVSFPILLDSDGKISEQWRVTGIPVTFILDSSGRLAYRESGIREWDSDAIIEKILELEQP